MSTEPTLEPIDFDGFYELCKAADWHYWASDDHRAYTKGGDECERLRVIAAAQPVYQPIYDAFLAWSQPSNRKPMPTRNDFTHLEHPEP